MRNDQSLRQLFQHQVDNVAPLPETWEIIEGRLRRRRLRDTGGRLVVIIVALFGGAGLVVWLWSVFGTASPVDRADKPTASQPGDASTIPDPQVAAQIPLPGTAAALASGEGDAWLSIVDQSGACAGTLIQVESSNDQIRQSVELEVAVEELAVGAGRVWGVGCTDTGRNALVAVDATTGEIVRQIEVSGGYPQDVAYGAASVWVAVAGDNGPDSVIRIDPVSVSEIARVGLPEGLVTNIDATSSAVWALVAEVSNATVGGSTIVRIDPLMNQLDGELDIDASPRAIAADEDHVWVEAWLSTFDESVGTGEDDRLVAVAIDSRSLQVEDSIAASGQFLPFGTSGNGVWFLGAADDEIAWLNLETRSVDATERIESAATVATLDGGGGGDIWISGGDQLVRVRF